MMDLDPICAMTRCHPLQAHNLFKQTILHPVINVDPLLGSHTQLRLHDLLNERASLTGSGLARRMIQQRWVALGLLVVLEEVG